MYYAVASSVSSFALLGACTTETPPAIESVPLPVCAHVLPTDLDAIVDAAPSFQGSQFSLVVRDAGNGEPVYERNSNQRLIPASTLKLLISAAALDILGPHFRFITSVHIVGSVKNGILQGSLYLRGTGDPTIQANEYTGLVAEVSLRGTRSISGNLAFDDTWFDGALAAPGWAQDDEGFAFDAPISALTASPDRRYNPATADIWERPSTTTWIPLSVLITALNGYIDILNAGLTGTSNTLTVTREHGLEHAVIHGTPPVDARPRVRSISVGNPNHYVADLFRRALYEQHVHIDGRIVIGEVTLADATLVAKRLSMSHPELIAPFLKQSTNGYAESLTKALGRSFKNEGSLARGIDAISTFLRDDGIDQPLRQVDCSGLSRYNSISTGTLSDMLINGSRKSWFDTWYSACPVAGDADPSIGGTLRYRMRGTTAENNAHTKTGSMGGVSGLSGYVTDADQRLLAFSMVKNNAVVSVKSVEGEIVAKLASLRSPPASCASFVPPSKIGGLRG